MCEEKKNVKHDWKGKVERTVSILLFSQYIHVQYIPIYAISILYKYIPICVLCTFVSTECYEIDL